MAINKKLISFATQAQFDAKLSAGNIDNRSIVFIEDKKRIWTHGVFFDTSWDFVTDKSNFTRTVAGLVPAPGAATTTRYLREDGTWVIPPNTGDTHWTTGIRAGASGTNANSVANDPFIKVLDNTNYKSQIQILGGTNITAKSDATGKITIDGTHNHDTVYVKKIGDTMTGSLTATSFVKSGVNAPQNYLLQADGGHILKSSFSGSDHTHPYLPLTGGTLTGALAINLGASANSPLSLTSAGVTTSIGSLNATWCHFDTTATTGFYFYKNIQTPLNITANTFIGALSGNASSATKVNNKLTLKFDTGTTENTNLYTYDGSAAKTIDIKAGSNVSFTKAGNTVTINSTNTTYSAMSVAEGTAGTATSSRTMRADYLKQIIQHYTGAYSSRAGGLGAASNSIEAKDTRSINPLPNTDLQRGVWFDFKTNSAIGLTGASTYSSVITMVPYGDNSGNTNTSFRLAQSGNNLYFQNWTTVWGTWNKIWHSGNFANGTTAQYIRGDGSLATYANTNSITGIRAGASGTTTNAIATDPYIKVLDDSTYRSQIRLLGSGATTVKSDAGGNVTISSTDTTYTTGTLAQLNTGTNTTGRLQSAKLLNDWLANRFQVVTALPISPAAGIFYFIKE